MAANVRQGASGHLSAVVLGAVLVALTAAVAVASRTSGHGAGSVVGSGSGTAHALGAVVLALGVIVCVAVTGLLVAVLWPSALRRKRGSQDDLYAPYRPDMTRWEKALILGLLTLVFGGAFGVIAVIYTHHGGPQPVTLGQGAAPGFTGSPAPSRSAPKPRATGGSSRLGGALIAGIALAIVAGLSVLLLSRRRRPPADAADRMRDQVAHTLEWSLEDLRREPDPRRAVIAAYARMERMFAAQGMGRRAFETPLEYLGRVLGQVHANGAAVGRLTGLFQRAKFSPHPVGSEERAQAVDTLGAIRDDLERK